MKRKVVKINAISFAKMCAAMVAGDLSCQEIAEETGLHYVTVLHYTRELHRAGAVHITRYDPDARMRHTLKIYKLGAGRDAKRIRMTQTERQARHRAKKKAMNDPLLRLAA